jgi:hypothetical protein
MIEIFDNFFNEQDYSKIIADSTVNWRLNKQKLYKDLTDNFYTEHCLKIIGDKINKPVSLYRAYIHGYYSNQPCGIHRDVNATHTVLFYVNPIYDRNWLGGTLIWTDKPNYIEFKPNRLVIFKAELEHTGIMFRHTEDCRIQCVWKINI